LNQEPSKSSRFLGCSIHSLIVVSFDNFDTSPFTSDSLLSRIIHDFWHHYVSFQIEIVGHPCHCSPMIAISGSKKLDIRHSRGKTQLFDWHRQGKSKPFG